MSVQIVSGATSDLLTVDPTSKAARVTPYDTLGNNRGVKATYRAATAVANSGVVVAAASAVPFFVIGGSGTKTVIIQRIVISGASLTSVAYGTLVVQKYSTVFSAGTPVTLTQVPLDSTSAAGTLSLCNVYTAAPTAGSLIGAIAAKRFLLQATTAAAAGLPTVIEFDFRTLGSENSGVYLRGATQQLAVGFGAAPATAVTVSAEVEWTEE